MTRLIFRVTAAALAVLALLAAPAALAGARIVGAQELGALIADELAGRAPDARHEVNFNGAPVMNVEEGETPRLLSLDYTERTGVFFAMIAPGAGADPMRLTGRIETLIDVPSVSQTISAGQRVSAADIVWIEMQARRLPTDSVLDPAQIEGLEAKRALRPGQPVRRYDVMVPSVIKKDDLVTVFYMRPGIQLAARGRALENAAEGAGFRVLNLQSNRVIEAVADSPGRARVETPRLYADNGAVQ